jgi:DNA-binding transcriptional LysR family regulator
LRKGWNTPLQESKHRDERPGARLNWDDVRVFAAVAAAGSINKAATELMLTPASVSRHIKDLEHRLQVRVFERHKSGVTLTEGGSDLLDRARSMQRMADDIESSVRGRDRRDEGGVTIATPDGLAALWIAPRIGDFLSRNPRIHVSMDCRAGPPRETDFRADIAITADAGQAQIGDDTSLLAMTHYIFVASPSYLETYGTPKSMAAAVGEHLTLRQSGQIFQRETWGPRANAIEALAQFSFESNSSLAVVAALRGGAGVATVPSYLLASAPELVIVGGESSVPIRLWRIVRKEAKDAARVLRVVEWLRSMFDTKTNPWFRDEFVPPTEFANFPAKDSPAKPEAKPRRG